MRIDENLKVFLPHPEWYVHKIGIGYVPTDQAPIEAVEAMKKYNSYSDMRDCEYHYTICPIFSDEAFDKTCVKIEQNLPNWSPMDLIRDTLDGDRIQRYVNTEGMIVVWNDFLVDACWVDSDIELSFLADYRGRNPHYHKLCKMYD